MKLEPPVLVVVPSSGGHHETYLRYVLDSRALRGRRVTCVAPRSYGAKLKPDLWPNIEVEHAVLESPAQGRGQRRNMLARCSWLVELRRLVAGRFEESAVQPEIFFLWADILYENLLVSVLFSVLFPFRSSGILFHSDCIDREVRSLAWSTACDLFSGFAGIRMHAMALGNISRVAHLSQQYPDLHIARLPEITSIDESEDCKLASEVRRIAGNRFIIALVGSVSARKGVNVFVQLVEGYAETDYFFVLAGRRSALSEKDSERVIGCAKRFPNFWISEDKYLSDSDMNGLIRISGALFAFYEDFTSSSNMLAKAANFRVPLLSSKSREMSLAVRTFSLGLIFGSREEIVGAGQGLASSVCRLRAAAEFEAGCERFLRENSNASFDLAICDTIVGVSGSDISI